MVENVAALHRKMEQIPVVIRKAVTEELERSANEVVASMRALVPVDDGTLRDSIGWTWGDAPSGSIKVGEVRGRKYGKIGITIYAGGGDAFYGRFQEFGTVKMPANPFFYPAWRANRRAVRSRLTRRINREVKKLNEGN